MENKNWTWIILGVVIIVIMVFLAIRNTTHVDETPFPEINKNTYQTDPNFEQLHPKGDQFSVGITGEEMNLLSLEENALIWGVDPELFVSEFNSKFKTNANKNSLLGNVLPNYKNSNRDVKILLDSLK